MIKYLKQKIQDNKSGFKVTQHWDWKMLDGLYEKKIGYREEPYIKNDLDKLILDNPRDLKGELTLTTKRYWWGNWEKSDKIGCGNERLFSEYSVVKDCPGKDYSNFRIRHGRCTQWYELSDFCAGKKFRKGKYKKGKKTGKWKWWYPEGNIQVIGSFKKGKSVGEWKFYDRDGNIELHLKDSSDILLIGFLRIQDNIFWEWDYGFMWDRHDFFDKYSHLNSYLDEDFDYDK